MDASEALPDAAINRINALTKSADFGNSKDFPGQTRRLEAPLKKITHDHNPRRDPTVT